MPTTRKRTLTAKPRDRIYKCINPVGIQEPVDTYPLAPRLDKNSLNGKEIYFSITGEPDVTIPLEKRLKMDYPDINWRVKRSFTPAPVALSEEEMKTAAAVIQAVCW